MVLQQTVKKKMAFPTRRWFVFTGIVLLALLVIWSSPDAEPKEETFDSLLLKPPLSLFVIVASSAPDRKARDALRSTWLSDRYFGSDINMTVVKWRFFVTGPSSVDLEAEQLEYNDVVVLNSTDSQPLDAFQQFHQALKWLNDTGADFDFVLKTDTNTFIHLTRLMFQLLPHKYVVRHLQQNIYAGQFLNPLQHEIRSQIDIQDWPLHEFFPFMHGSAAVFSAPLVRMLLQRFQNPCSLVPGGQLVDLTLGVIIEGSLRDSDEAYHTVFKQIAGCGLGCSAETECQSVTIPRMVTALHPVDIPLQHQLYSHIIEKDLPLLRKDAAAVRWLEVIQVPNESRSIESNKTKCCAQHCYVENPYSSNPEKINSWILKYFSHDLEIFFFSYI